MSMASYRMRGGSPTPRTVGGGRAPRSTTTLRAGPFAGFAGVPRAEVRIALCIPLGGSAGIWGPSALASAKLAATELNAGPGIGGRACRLLTVNSADDMPGIEATLRELVDQGEIDAIVGMHTSAVRHRILHAVGGELPFVYTPLYEGGETTPGVHAIGETPARQLGPAIAWLSQHERPRRWLFVGNDYVWPRVSHGLARRYVSAAGAQVVAEHYVPFGAADYGQVLDSVRRSRADAVLMSLIGQDAVDFNRAFAQQGLERSALRLSCAIEENELLGIGSDNTDRLYVAAGYFGSLDTPANLAFKERYHAHFGERAPTLNTLGQSTYEGVHYLAAIFGAGSADKDRPSAISHQSARNAVYGRGGISEAPIYLARAEGHAFRVIANLQPSA
jgi:ABC-type branched-subunit amino acid transport system substrate-binding protein